jgi:hypothetical protein
LNLEGLVASFTTRAENFINIKCRAPPKIENSSIFSMRYMEKYTRRGKFGFHTGLEMIERDKISDLRIKYMCKILTSQANTFCSKIMEEYNEYEELSDEDKSILMSLSYVLIPRRLQGKDNN